MSTPLIPLAISSQLDVTGEERIHAGGGYSISARIPWSNPILTANTLALGFTRGIQRGTYSDDSFAIVTNNLPVGSTVLAATFAAGHMFIHGQRPTGTSRVWDSTEASAFGTWTEHSTGLPSIGDYYSIAYGNGLLVALGSWNASRSSDLATSWTSVAIPKVDAFAGINPFLTFADGLFVTQAISLDGAATIRARYSSDAVTWNNSIIVAGGPSLSAHSRIVWTGAKWLIVLSDSTVWTSDDLVTWVSVATLSDLVPSFSFNSCAATDSGLVVVTGQDALGGPVNVYSSDHASTWGLGDYPAAGALSPLHQAHGIIWDYNMATLDGVDWKPITYGVGTSSNFRGVVGYE